MATKENAFSGVEELAPSNSGWRIRWSIAVSVGALSVSALAALILFLLPIFVSGGNGQQLANIAAGPVLFVSLAAGGAVAASAVLGGLLGDLLQIRHEMAARVRALVAGAGIATVPVGLAISYFLDSSVILTVTCIAAIAAIGSLAARKWVSRTTPSKTNQAKTDQ